jgi:hypothetical protein
MGKSVIAVVSLLACSGAPPPPPDPNAQTAEFRFNITDNVRQSPMLSRPPKGTAYANLYLSEDVTISGPRNGAVAQGSVQIDLDMTNGLSDAGFTTAKLAPNDYTFLGFCDTNGNGATSMNPDTGDLVTLPTTNQFTIVDGGMQLNKTILFDLIYN